MNVLDVLSEPWAMLPHKLQEITDVYLRHAAGDRLSAAEIAERIGKPVPTKPEGADTRLYSIQGSDEKVAVLPVMGVLAKRMNMMTAISGGSSTEVLANELRYLIGQANIKAVVLAIDSPGGTVDGTEALARYVAEQRGRKPIVAWVDGMMASAAYWIGSAADAVFVGSNTDVVGSIGVAMQHIDSSGADAMQGVKRTDIFAGKYKRIASDARPLTGAGREYLQSSVDWIYSAFVDSVARNRGVPVDQVLGSMADGRIFMGQQAVDVGLADGFSTLNALTFQLLSGAYQPRRQAA